MVASSSSPPSPPSPATPLWRNGPKAKRVLCNACVSRYRLNGTLRAYMPRHYHQGLRKNLDNSKDTVISNVKDEPSTNVDIPTSGKRILSFWDNIPSRKRSKVVYKRITPMERFHSLLYNMEGIHGNPDEPEEVLLEQNMTNNFIPNDEIGLGAVLLKPEDDDDAPPAKKASN